MQLEFVPIEDFYFALTLAVRPLEDIGDGDLVAKVRSRLELLCGQPSTIAAATQNNFNYVFIVSNDSNSPAPTSLVVSVADWQNKLRLSSDYGWALDKERKPVRTELFNQRADFTHQLRVHLESWLEVPLPVA